MIDECLVKGTPAMIAGILESRSITLEEDQQPAPDVRIVGWPLPVDALDALLKVYGRRGFVDPGTPGSGFAWLRLVQELDGVTRLSINCDSADWEEFGLRFWYRGLRGELARRGLLVTMESVVIGGGETTAAAGPAARHEKLTAEQEALLRRLWANDYYTVEEIANELGYSEDNLRKRIAKDLKLPERKRGRKAGR